MYKADVLSVQMLTYQMYLQIISETITAHIFGWSESKPELCLGQAQTHLPQVHSLCVFLVKDPALVADNDIMRDYLSQSLSAVTTKVKDMYAACISIESPADRHFFAPTTCLCDVRVIRSPRCRR